MAVFTCSQPLVLKLTEPSQQSGPVRPSTAMPLVWQMYRLPLVLVPIVISTPASTNWCSSGFSAVPLDWEWSR
ncbi:hypothetical protein HUW46_07613 [Amycolatopsis sp. CA-230715]|nr:hypothetical protein HUW46_07613 [Amycolatopsis sp. CA-230715]